MLAAALALPANVVPAEILDQKPGIEQPHIVLNQENPIEKATDSNARKEELTGTKVEIPDQKTEARQPHIVLNQENPIEKATDSNAKQEKKEEQIIYNTGSFNVHVVSAEDFAKDLGDAYFEKDGSYTINIPEENPFFPYEVQFTYDGKTENEWFMNPEDSIEIDGHTFYVSASFDGTAVTQMTMEVAGQEVVVYPKEKEFTDGDDVALMSLLPLEERNLSVDLSGFSPIELSRVKVASIFSGTNQLKSTDKIRFKPKYTSEDVYEHDFEGYIDLSYGTSGRDHVDWEMIVGNPDQLDASNIRYYVDIKVTDTENWLIPTVTIHNEDGTTKNVTVTESRYYDYPGNGYIRNMAVDVPVEGKEFNGNPEMTVSLKINSGLFGRSVISEITADTSSDEVQCQAVSRDDGWYIDVTGKMNRITDIRLLMSGYSINGPEREYISSLNFEFHLNMNTDYVFANLYDKTGNDIGHRTRWEHDEDNARNFEKYIFSLWDSYADNDRYRLVLTFKKAVETSENQIIGAFIGKYESLDAARAAGAVDVKESLFDRNRGYEADFSKGVYVSVFRGKTDAPSADLIRDRWHFYTESEPFLSGSSYVSFDGIKDAQGNSVNCKILKPDYGAYKDDYADFAYTTILVGENTDITSLAPVFSKGKGLKLYTDKEEISGVSLHDFSNGPVHYTATAENSESSKNYWLQIIKPKQNESWLYMNSLADENSNTRKENGVVYTTREVMLNGIHDYEHRIILANMGTKALSKLSVKAEGKSFDTMGVFLNDYWTLKGEHDLSGYQGLAGNTLANLAKLKLRCDTSYIREANGQDLTGTLTIMEDGTPIMVINLTGVVGDPGIVTTEFRDAVKYVHYGSVIQNNNKYDFNTVSYRLIEGKLPSGMELKPNGELYGVPLETGEFTFTVQMNNSYSKFANVTKEFTLKVVDNTDANVDSAVDQGYELKERVPEILLSDNKDYTMTSIGVIEEWDNLTLDGKRLVEGVDFDAKSGSTRLTIRSQTLKANNQVGTHTLSAEFREKGTGTLKRASQNYKVSTKSSEGSSSGGSSSGGHSSSGRATVRADYGNIGADGAWVQDAKGWKCKAADGTWYTNCWKELTYQNEKSWYRFDAQGYLVTGWYQDNGTWYYLNPKSDGKLGKMMTGWQYINDIWYYFTENAGDKQGAMFCKRWAEVPYNGTVEWYYFDENGTMKTDWLTLDENKFYLYPIADGTRGRMLTGWQKIGDNWYYFHEESDGNKGVMARRTKIGKYYVNTDGVWAK